MGRKRGMPSTSRGTTSRPSGGCDADPRRRRSQLENVYVAHTSWEERDFATSRGMPSFIPALYIEHTCPQLVQLSVFWVPAAETRRPDPHPASLKTREGIPHG